MFRVPEYGLDYADEVFSRVKHLVLSKIWDGIEVVDLELWLRNFETDEEKYFAACLLDILIYRSNTHKISNLHHILDIVIPSLLLETSNDLALSFDWKVEFKKHKHQSIFRICVPKLNPEEATSSANQVAKFLRDHCGVRECFFISPRDVVKELKSGAEIIIFVDDFLGSGSQFKKYLKKFPLLENGKYMYTPIMAFQEGIKAIQDIEPNLIICPSELLDSTHIALCEHNLRYFKDNSLEDVQNFYVEFLKKKELKCSINPLGWDNLGLSIGMQDNCPNNTLPIYYWEQEHVNWDRFLKRSY